MLSKQLLATCALGALLATPLAATPAAAQATQSADQPAGDTEMIDALPPAPEGAAGDTAQATTEGEAAPIRADAADAVALEGGFIARQGETHLLGSAVMDAEVVTMADESLGSVEDILIDVDGRVIGVIVGVGGFLGIGEKQVAIPTASLEVRYSDDVAAEAEAGAGMETTARAGEGLAATGGTDIEMIVVDFTRDQLEAAPDFIRLDEEGRAAAEAPADATQPIEATGATPEGQGTPLPVPADETTDTEAQPRQ